MTKKARGLGFPRQSLGRKIAGWIMMWGFMAWLMLAALGFATTLGGGRNPDAPQWFFELVMIAFYAAVVALGCVAVGLAIYFVRQKVRARNQLRDN
ncbi:hypothetical protein ACPTKS_30650 [Pseudomonas aeruginosa]|uniref:hypothetical protein n=1 Tax=Pseudomonas aeruginosa TaxID=287 RepID=UPI003CC64537